MRLPLAVFAFAALLGVLYWLPTIHLVAQTALDFFGSDSVSAQLPKRSVFVGDVMLARSVEKVMRTNGPEYPYQRLDQLFTNALVVGNFEAAVPEIHTPTPDFTFAFSVATEFLPALRTAGFTHMSVANNHSFDFERAGFAHTVESLRAVDIMPFGHESTDTSYLTVEGGTIAVTGLNAASEAIDLERVQENFYTVSSQSDIQIAYIHWGEEYVEIHSYAQEALAQQLIDLGYDAIIGHHPHVIQDIGWYKESPIFYSLGNFIFDQFFSPAVQNGLAVEVSFDDETVLYRLQGVTSSDSRSQPRPFTEAENTALLQRLSVVSPEVIASQVSAGEITQQIK